MSSGRGRAPAHHFRRNSDVRAAWNRLLQSSQMMRRIRLSPRRYPSRGAADGSSATTTLLISSTRMNFQPTRSPLELPPRVCQQEIT